MKETNLTTQQSPVPGQPAPKKKKGGKIALVVIAVIVVIAVAAVAAVSALGSSPMALVAKGLENTADAAAQSELARLGLALQEGGSLEASLDLASITQNILGIPLEGRAAAKLYFAPNSLGVDAVAELGGTPLLDAAALLSLQEIILSSDALLGDAVYGVDLEQVEQNFDSSVFGPDGPYSLGGITAEDISALLDALQMPEDPQALSEEARTILTDLSLVVFQSIQDHTEVTKETSSLLFHGQDCATTAVIAAADGEGLAAIARDILTYANTDEALRDFLNRNAAAVASSTLSYYSYTPISGEELVDRFYEGVEEALSAVDELEEEAVEAGFAAELTFHISKAGSYLVGMELDMTAYGEDVSVQALFGPSPAELREWALRFMSPGLSMDLSYLVTANSGSAYAGEMKAVMDGMELAAGTVSWNRESGDISVTVTGNGEDFTLEGILLHEDTSTSLTVRSLRSELRGLDVDPGLTLILIPGEKMAPMGDYTDVLTMSSDEIDGVLMQLYGAVMQLAGILG